MEALKTLHHMPYHQSRILQLIREQPIVDPMLEENYVIPYVTKHHKVFLPSNQYLKPPWDKSCLHDREVVSMTENSTQEAKGEGIHRVDRMVVELGGGDGLSPGDGCGVIKVGRCGCGDVEAFVGLTGTTVIFMWKEKILTATVFAALYGLVELLYLLAAIYKIREGAWIPLIYLCNSVLRSNSQEPLVYSAKEDDRASLFCAMVLEEANVFRQYFCRVLADVLYQWMSKALGKSTKFSSDVQLATGTLSPKLIRNSSHLADQQIFLQSSGLSMKELLCTIPKAETISRRQIVCPLPHVYIAIDA
nr:potassium transporter 1 [Ipomoea batatas]